MLRWTRFRVAIACLLAVCIGALGYGTFLEVTGRFDEPCEQAGGGSAENGNVTRLWISPKAGVAYDQRQYAAKECEGPDWWNIPFEGWLAILTLALVIGTGALAYYTASLVIDTRRSALSQLRAAANSLRVARRQLEEAEVAHKTELRAYINIGAVVLRRVDAAGFFKAEAIIEFVNYGKTPAHDVQTFGHFEAKDWPFTEPGPVGEKDERATRASVGPGGSRFRIDDATVENWNDVAGGTYEAPTKKCFLAWGKIVYRDAFGNRHTTHYKWCLGGIFAEGIGSRIEGGGLQYRMSGYWNGNDAD